MITQNSVKVDINTSPGFNSSCIVKAYSKFNICDAFLKASKNGYLNVELQASLISDSDDTQNIELINGEVSDKKSITSQEIVNTIANTYCPNGVSVPVNIIDNSSYPI